MARRPGRPRWRRHGSDGRRHRAGWHRAGRHRAGWQPTGRWRSGWPLRSGWPTRDEGTHRSSGGRRSRQRLSRRHRLSCWRGRAWVHRRHRGYPLPRRCGPRLGDRRTQGNRLTWGACRAWGDRQAWRRCWRVGGARRRCRFHAVGCVRQSVTPVQAAGVSETPLDRLAERRWWSLRLIGLADTLQRLVILGAVDLEDAAGWLGLLRVRGGQLPDLGEVDRDAHALRATTDHPVLVIQERWLGRLRSAALVALAGGQVVEALAVPTHPPPGSCHGHSIPTRRRFSPHRNGTTEWDFGSVRGS